MPEARRPSSSNAEQWPERGTSDEDTSEDSDSTGSESTSDSAESSGQSGPEQTNENEECPEHPLEDEWSFWYLDPERSEDWTECIIKIDDFNTVEGCWRLFNHIHGPDGMKVGSDLMVFKKGIFPTWEDDRNKNGGRWMLKVEYSERNRFCGPAGFRVPCPTLAWRELILLLIGSTIGQYKDENGQQKDDERVRGMVNGIIVQARAKCDKFSLWMDNCEDEAAIKTAGQAFKQQLSYLEFSQPYNYARLSDVAKGKLAKSMFHLPPSR